MSSPCPPPPPSPLHDPSTSAVVVADRQRSLSLSPTLLIIVTIIVVVVVASAFIHLLLRFLSICRRSASPSSVAALPRPLVRPNSSSSSSGAPAAASAEVAAECILSDQEKAALIDSLPVFSLATALSALPKCSPDCAVCLSAFLPHDKLRLLPACCHAFHSSCVDVWLRNTPSCPLCRASIAFPTVPVLSPLPASDRPDTSRSGSFRIELGSVSRRRTPSWEEPGNPPPHLRSYSIGSSFEYVVEEETEAVVERVARRREKIEKRGESDSSAPAPRGEVVAEAAGGGGLGWLREYVDRLASSASSSLSSLRFSERWSHRYDGDVSRGRNSWDLEATARQEMEEGGYFGLYKWLIGE